MHGGYSQIIKSCNICESLAPQKVVVIVVHVLSDGQPNIAQDARFHKGMAIMLKQSLVKWVTSGILASNTSLQIEPSD